MHFDAVTSHVPLITLIWRPIALKMPTHAGMNGKFKNETNLWLILIENFAKNEVYVYFWGQCDA